MRLTQIVFRQHIGRMFKKHWIIQGRRIPIDTGAEVELKSRSVEVCDPEEVIKENPKPVKLNVIGYLPPKVSNNETHPNWHERICHTFSDKNVLVEGIKQAKVITKTVCIHDGLPDVVSIKPEDNNSELDKRTIQAVLSSFVFDAEQKKLPIVKDPNRPAWNFPRTYGITPSRRARILTSKILHICEAEAESTLTNERTILNEAWFSVPFERNENLLQIQLTADSFLMSNKALPPIHSENTENEDLVDLFPITFTVSLPTNNIYVLEDFYPIGYLTSAKVYAPHTIFVHHDTTKVRNLYETEVLEHQILGRSLMKSFATAASYARLKYGPSIKELPEPVTLQCINTDGKFFHFGMFQLNTLNLQESDGIKNLWFDIPMMSLFDVCEYIKGQPIIEGYNPNIIKQIMAFYNNR